MRIAGRRSGPAVLAVGLALVAVLLSSCAVGPSSRPPVAVRGASAVDGAPEAPPPPPTAHGPTLPVPDVGNADEAGFLDCTEDIQPVLPVPVPADRSLRYECSDVPVDSDYSIGRRRQSSIGLMRVSLSDQPPDARPPLLVLGDSDGETGTLRAARLAAQVPLSVLQHFTLVGMDRRGEGTSRLDCAPPDTRGELVDADLTGTGQAGVDMLLEEARKAVQECSLTEGDTLTKYDTADTAGDIEHARQLLGVRTLGGVGLGDGARAMAIWAQQSPASVGRLVLDSPPDPTQDAIGATDARASASEATFDAFARDCQSRVNCPLGTDARATLTTLAGQLRARPIPGPDGELLTSGAMLNAVLIGLDDPGEWPDLAWSIGAARNGDAGGLLRRLDQLLGLNGRFDLALATRCNDTAQRVNPPQLAKLIEKWQTDHPLFGSVLAQQLLYCSAWPVPTDAAKEGPAAAAPPMLVLATALSPRVPSQGYQRAADQLAPATLVNWQGAGRGAYPRTTCVTNAVDSLWVKGAIPQASVLCPP